MPPSATPKKYSHKIRQKRLAKVTYRLFKPLHHDTYFLPALAFLTLTACLVTPYPQVARWFGFLLSSYAVIGNDSIQALGLLITAQSHRKPWWFLWSFIATLFIVTITYSWYTYQGDVSYGRLATQGLEERPEHLTFWHLVTPILLLALTQWRIPVSTTFLLLNTFATTPTLLQEMLLKSLLGYLVAFLVALLAWSLALYAFPQTLTGKPHKGWFLAQWVSSGLLWSAWLMQDGANIAVYLPPALAFHELLLFLLVGTLGLGLIFYQQGGQLQVLVDSKAGITDIRAATLVSFFYMLMLFLFKVISPVPMSTTSLFIGLLGGRELAKSLVHPHPQRSKRMRKSLYLLGRDLLYLLLGLALAIVLTVYVNPSILPCA